MPKKKPTDPNEKPQKKRFIEFAREHGADDGGKGLDKALKRIAPAKKAGKR